MKILGATALTAFLTIALAGTAMAAQPRVALGTAANFAVLAGQTITNTGPTTITGSVGLAPGSSVTGFASVTLHGAKNIASATAIKAQNDLTTAYNDAAGRTPKTAVPVELGGKTLKAGVYSSGTLGLTGTLKLDAQGNPNAVFIFQAASTLITASSSKVTLINGASACNVYWKVGSSATLAPSTRFVGTILALTSIKLQTGARLQGRALARNGSVTLDTNVITTAGCQAGTSNSGGGATPPATDTLNEATGTSGPAILPVVFGFMFVFTITLVGALRFATSRTRSRR